jgi:hypothetical protein
MNIPIEGISISETPEVIHIQSASPLTTLSSDEIFFIANA